jgi:lipoprotein NlpD
MTHRLLLFSPVCTRPGFLILLSGLLLCTACHRGAVLPESSSKAQGVYHAVQKGQTLWRICKTYQVSMQDVAELNNITDHSQIEVGDRLFIPGAKSVLNVPATAGAAAQPPIGGGPSPGTGTRVEPPGQEPLMPVIEKNVGMFIWPLIGPVTKRFGIHGGLKHDGIDIKGPPGAEVKASRGGKVIFSALLEGYGNTVIVQHDKSFVTVYANLGEHAVSRDQQVRQSQVLGRLPGGPPDTCYLQFQVRHDRKARNPLFYLPEAR